MRLSLVLLFSIVPLAVAGTGCQPGPDAAAIDPFLSALPSAATLDISMPGTATTTQSSIRAGLGQRLPAMAGAPGNDDPELPSAPSAFHEATMQTMASLNVILLRLLEPIDAATAAAIPVLDGSDAATWRGFSPDGTEEHLMVIHRMAGGYFDTYMASRSTSEPGASWRHRLTGSYTPNTHPGAGQGSMWVDLGTDIDPASEGKVLVLWSILGGEREVAVFEYDVVTSGGQDKAHHGSSRFHERADGSGEFVFQGPATFDTGEGDVKTFEDALIVTRWTPESDGRTDVHVTGNDAQDDGFQEEVASQCWLQHGSVTTYDAIEGREKGDSEGSPGGRKMIKVLGLNEDCPYVEPSDDLAPSRPDEPLTPDLPSEAD